MLFTAFFFYLCPLLLTVTGQVVPDFPEQSYNLEANDEMPLLENIPTLRDVDSNNHRRRFLESLIFEAGRHVLFPEYYSERRGQQEDDRAGEKVSEGMRYIEMKGQPEIEESYLNRMPRTDISECSKIGECTKYKPVCGTDGKVYPSECHLLKENCGGKNNNVSSGQWSKCLGNHYLCPSRCLDFNEPVCGSDLRIYHNICLMRKKNCGKLVQKLPLAVCYERFSKEVGKMECPNDCQPVAKPACGSDGIIYFNECILRMRTCKQGIVEVAMDNCLVIPKCPQVCLPFYDPVCGSDGNLYTNLCRMLQTNCGEEVTKMPLSFCQGSR